MKRISQILIGIFISAIVVYAATNITITFSIPDEKYTNLLSVVEKSGDTNVESYVINRINRSVEDERISKLLTLWNNANLVQQENAYRALVTLVNTNN